ncbi:MAG: hypothetical protein PWQ67_2435 [Clostridia bacterium]|jgi:hypothetical protein|nr:hypothetical protein [Clostridia bacterium]MDN5323981.1 hypothetical protein [Clostridia bacterium]
MNEFKKVIGIVTIDKDIILKSGAPVILVKNEDELQKISSELGKILAGNVYRLSNGLVLITST